MDPSNPGHTRQSRSVAGSRWCSYKHLIRTRPGCFAAVLVAVLSHRRRFASASVVCSASDIFTCRGAASTVRGAGTVVCRCRCIQCCPPARPARALGTSAICIRYCTSEFVLRVVLWCYQQREPAGSGASHVSVLYTLLSVAGQVIGRPLADGRFISTVHTLRSSYPLGCCLPAIAKVSHCRRFTLPLAVSRSLGRPLVGC